MASWLKMVFYGEPIIGVCWTVIGAILAASAYDYFFGRDDSESIKDNSGGKVNEEDVLFILLPLEQRRLNNELD